MPLVSNETPADPTSRVSHPPTMLRPRPTFPLHISIMDSVPATTGQLWASETSDLPAGWPEEDVGEEEEDGGGGSADGGRLACARGGGGGMWRE